VSNRAFAPLILPEFGWFREATSYGRPAKASGVPAWSRSRSPALH